MNASQTNSNRRPFVLGLIMTDEWAASPNMGETQGEGASKAARMKAIKSSEGWKTLISGQAIGSWHRQTLYDRYGWKISELQETISGRDTRSFYTQCQPIAYEEDDGRGYMAAVKIQEKKKGKDGKDWKVQFTTKRTSPFMLSQFQSIAPNVRMTDYGVLARGLDDLPEDVKGGLIFKSEIASAAYTGLFALNLSELGTFRVGFGRDLLPFDQAELQELMTAADLPYKDILEKKKKSQSLTDAENEKYKTLVMLLKRCVNSKRDTIVQLTREERKRRAHDLIAAMADLEGGANMTRRLYNVAPASALIAFMDGGNCLPPHIFRAVVKDEDDKGNKAFKFVVDIPRLHKILIDNKNRFLTEDKEGFCNLYFGTLGSPTIDNANEVEQYLKGEAADKPPSSIKAKVCVGPREAIRDAAKAVPIEWFDNLKNAIKSDELTFGEDLLK